MPAQLLVLHFVSSLLPLSLKITEKTYTLEGKNMAAAHRFTRTEIMLGTTGLETLRRSRVTICGVGGVGSYAAEALGRGGVGSITLIDFDKICVTNINRQLHALDTTVGLPKVEVMAERLLLINPEAEISALNEFICDDNLERLLTPRPDFVLDAIDHFTSKAALIIWCRTHGIPVISSMGAATKRDPSRIHVTDISKTHSCRMARSLRKILKQKGISSGVEVVYSTEEFNSSSIAEPAAQEQENCTGIKKRVTLGSVSFIPSIFGLTMAGVVINKLLDKDVTT